MNSQLQALKAELLKCKHAQIIPITFMVFAMFPIMIAVFLLLMQNPDAQAKGAISTKMDMLSVSADWNALFVLLTQGMAIGGVVLFGFLVSWIFGREYSDNTLKDLLSLPTSKTEIINAKFMVYLIWAVTLSIYVLLLCLMVGALLKLPDFEVGVFWVHIQEYALTTLLTLLLGFPIAIFAMLGRGYLAPLGFVVLTVVFSQVIGAIGWGHYFPWAIPAIYSGAAGEYKAYLNILSYAILVIVSVIGYCMAVVYWKNTDHSK